ncbi:HAD family phosphatase [Arthrobacter sp. Y-9]|uniref:HAD family hydrolase n=1 Tax=Arthrobacter sp. Y-9 TaxID=3039385 RepID=UPI00241E9501|nr:HAD family phosphatase [Arthrobacter sp. Y-9]WFR83597.1 HAD family phosphatase [Arthrobacter sp. Y-9]
MPQHSSAPDAVRALLDSAEAVLFDFNGTLSLDEDLMARLYADAAREVCGLELTPEEYGERFVGLSDPDICAALASGDERLAARILDHLCEAYLREIRQEPRIPAAHVAVVRELVAAGTRVAVVTGTQRRLLEPALEDSGLSGLISATVCSDDVERGKPDPEGFLRGAELLGAAASATVVFEDSLAGVAAARAAGMRCVLVGSLATATPATGSPTEVHPLGELAALAA